MLLPIQIWMFGVNKTGLIAKISIKYVLPTCIWKYFWRILRYFTFFGNFAGPQPREISEALLIESTGNSVSYDLALILMSCAAYIICVVVQLFILGLNFILLCLKSIIIHFHTPKRRNIKLKLRIKLNHNI